MPEHCPNSLRVFHNRLRKINDNPDSQSPRCTSEEKILTTGQGFRILYLTSNTSALLEPEPGTPPESPGAHVPRTSDCDRAHFPSARDSIRRPRLELAESGPSLAQAQALIHTMYAWRGYSHSENSTRRPDEITLLARDGDRAVATISVRTGVSGALAAETLYPEEVQMLREAGGKPCEFTRLATDRTGKALDLLATVFHAAYLYARRLQGRTDLLVEVNPRHGPFYRQMLGFRQLGSERICPRVNAPALLLWLPLRIPEDQVARHGGKGEVPGIRSLYPRFLAPVEEAAFIADIFTTIPRLAVA